MPTWLWIIGANAILGLACYARGLYLELRDTKEKLANAFEAVKYLEAKLQMEMEARNCDSI